MKHTLSVLAACVVLVSISLGQSGSINNTLGTGGSFTIKDGSTTFFTLSQSDGKVSLSDIMIFKASDRFIHTFQESGTDGMNTFMGINAGNFTMAGTGLQASYNTAVGFGSFSGNTTGYGNSAHGYLSLQANSTGWGNSSFGAYSLSSNTAGTNNSAFGFLSLNANLTGYDNSAFGSSSLEKSTGHSNSAFGAYSLKLNTTGERNSAFGRNSLFSNTTGSYNSTFGSYSMESNTTGASNSAFGYRSAQNNTTGFGNAAQGAFALNNNTTGSAGTAAGYFSVSSNTTGWGNSGFGNYALYSNSTGSFNTAVGDSSGYGITTGSNNTTLGYDAQVPTATASNQVRIGNASVTYAGVEVPWTVTSDRRRKTSISSSELGLDFVSRLHPVSYVRVNDEQRRTEFGFIAQEVDDALKQHEMTNAGMILIDDDGTYQLRYNDLFAPLVKAIQELKTENDALRKELSAVHTSLAQIRKALDTRGGDLSLVDPKDSQ